MEMHLDCAKMKKEKVYLLALSWWRAILAQIQKMKLKKKTVNTHAHTHTYTHTRAHTAITTEKTEEKKILRWKKIKEKRIYNVSINTFSCFSQPYVCIQN